MEEGVQSQTGRGLSRALDCVGICSLLKWLQVSPGETVLNGPASRRGSKVGDGVSSCHAFFLLCKASHFTRGS